MEVIAFSKSLTITNLDQLAKGTGARYLEVLPDVLNLPPNRKSVQAIYIAVAWRRTMPADTKTNKRHMLIDFKPELTSAHLETLIEQAEEPLAPVANPDKNLLADLFSVPVKTKTRKVAGNTVSKSAKVQPASVAKRESLLDCSGCRQPLSKRVAGRGFTKCLSCRKAS